MENLAPQVMTRLSNSAQTGSPEEYSNEKPPRDTRKRQFSRGHEESHKIAPLVPDLVVGIPGVGSVD